MLELSDNEKRDVIRFIEAGKPLPDEYRFKLFGDKREVELVWNGKTNEVTNVVLPFQTIEQIDEPRDEGNTKLQIDLFDMSGKQIRDWTNKLIWGDNKLILSSLKNGPLREEIEKQGGIKLIYIDPPFDVGADFSMDIEIGDQTFHKEPTILEELAYRDTWGKGADSFIAMIFERIQLMYELLAEDGSIYVHCDSRVSAYLKLVLDEIFGVENKKAEIIWKRSSAHNDSQSYGNIHDTIHFYSKSDKYIWNPTYTEYEEQYIEQYYRYKDPDGRRWLSRDCTAPGGRGPRYEWNGHVRNWRYTKERMQELHDNNKLFYTENGIPRLKQYMDEMPGVPTQTLWIDKKVQAINSWHQEDAAYPTQKPEALLERIISASSNEGDLIADFFIGSGTTLAAAEKVNRKWIGTDLGKFSIHTARKRLIGTQRGLKKKGVDYRAFEILNLGKYERQYYTHKNEVRGQQYVNLILEAYKAQPDSSFETIAGIKNNRLVAIGPIDMPASREFVLDVIKESVNGGFTKIDVLAFEFEMGLFPEIQDEAKHLGADLVLKYIPRDVFDKRAIEKNQVTFYDVSFLEIRPHIKKRAISIELLDFASFFTQESAAQVESILKNGSSKIIIDSGQILKINKDQAGIVSREVLTKKWTDWIDYWSVDFNYESKKETVRVKDEGGAITDKWTGNYVFENDWQSFRTKKDRQLELQTPFIEVTPGKRVIAVKVIDIFGNDTMKTIEVNI